MDRSEEIRGRMARRLISLVALALLPLGAAAQTDFGLWTSIGAEKKLSKKWTIGAEADFRTRNDSKTADRWTFGVEGEYKICRGLKASAGYTLLYDNAPEKITYNSSVVNDVVTYSYNNWRPSYWRIRHRFQVSLAGSVDAGRWSFSLRERWQYTYRPESTTDRFDWDNAWWEETTVKSKNKNVLRSRIKVDYNIKNCKIDPYASAELFNAWSLEKTRFIVGADWKIKKAHVVGIYYGFQKANDDNDDDDVDSHLLGLSYKFKF